KIAATGGVTGAEEIGYAGTPELLAATLRAECAEAHAAGILVAAHARGLASALATKPGDGRAVEHGSSMSPEIVVLYLDNPASLRSFSTMIPTLLACMPLVKLSNDLGRVAKAFLGAGVLR